MAEADSSLKTALAGVGATVYGLMLPNEKAPPAVIYQRISSVPIISHNGAMLLFKERFQVRVLAATYASMRTITKAVETALIGNQTNFVLCVPAGSGGPDDRDGDLRISTRDYFIFSTP